MTYSVFVWNRKLSTEQKHGSFYKHLNHETAKFGKKYSHPVLCSKGKVYKMLPILEFIDRLNQSMQHTGANRACDNEIEQDT